jgi:hypothetical protein
MSSWPRLLGLSLAACSTFGSTPELVDASATDSGPRDAGGTEASAEAGVSSAYNPAGTIPCQDTVCQPPQLCCVRNSTPNTCVTSQCKAPDEAAVRCSDTTSCAGGRHCCMRLFNFRVVTVVCEEECAEVAGASGVFRLCSEDDASKVCGGRVCGPVESVIEAKTYPGLDVRVCQ